jgi:hypothetical protein
LPDEQNQEVKGGAAEEFGFTEKPPYEAETARWLAIGLLLLFAGILATQYTLIAIFAEKAGSQKNQNSITPVIERLERLFDIVLPILMVLSCA